jgi:hypothetical protein
MRLKPVTDYSKTFEGSGKSVEPLKNPLSVAKMCPHKNPWGD